jgi:DNA uptake protein ComE-like DNA-binding protein
MEIKINKCSAGELLKIVHIGKKRAQKIIENRPFRDVYELSKIPGIGKKRMQDIIARTENQLNFSK